MNTKRLAMFAVPILLTSSTALAQTQTTDDGACNTPTVHPQSKAKPKAAKAHAAKAAPAPAPDATETTVTEETETEDMTPTPIPAPTPESEPAPAPAPATEADTTTVSPPVSTTTTTYAEVRDTTEEAPAARRRSNVQDRWSAEPLVGYGSNNFRTGVGGRVGYTFDKLPIYVGGTFMWHSGDTDTFVGAGSRAETKQNFYYPAAEVGYDLEVGPVMVRPYGGAGVLFDRSRASVNNVSSVNTDTQFMLYPGITAHYTLPQTPVYVGADSRVLLPVDHGGASVQVFGVAGLSL